ncbi:MAG: aspartyl-phosphate phosphatase Spo0E family protein [Sporomusaceae bacterium]|nr:aspartyl-phosphate phosphatase Spo0E family protein [Sporomusaceae bacterium]
MLKELQEEIEKHRLALIDVLAHKGSLSTEAIKLNKILDEKVKEYQLLRRRLA